MRVDKQLSPTNLIPVITLVTFLALDHGLKLAVEDNMFIRQRPLVRFDRRTTVFNTLLFVIRCRYPHDFKIHKTQEMSEPCTCSSRRIANNCSSLLIHVIQKSSSMLAKTPVSAIDPTTVSSLLCTILAFLFVTRCNFQFLLHRHAAFLSLRKLHGTRSQIGRKESTARGSAR